MQERSGVVSEMGEPIVLREFYKHARLVFQEKLSRGKEFVDIRVWRFWENDNQWHAGKNGLFIDKEELLPMMSKIANILALETQSKKPGGI